MAMYIRVKRTKTTYFLHCDPSETVNDIKQKLQVLTDNKVESQRLVLVSAHQHHVLDDSKTLADQKVENDAVVALTLKLPDSNEWEEVTIDKPFNQLSGSAMDG
eukprot:TRINITY_DN16070_c0_g1_i1.p1 TRINITY_DN16070_c0_g1~~TRINITY_DN16070_c0_g1_i1.p1  ORF type:complete len:104 (-),score=20.42 TRINITY_DN16070_c0_g1_i1:259-570(-)